VAPARYGEPEPAITAPPEKSVQGKKEKAPAEKATTPPKQEVLQFEPVTRGRFEKSEPTIIEGEDLDVPNPERSEAQSRDPADLRKVSLRDSSTSLGMTKFMTSSSDPAQQSSFR
jgi:hypothetical protein